MRSLESIAFAVLRIVGGSMFAWHGLTKLTGWLAKGPVPFGSQMWFGGVIELVAGVLIAIGLLTRCAALLASGTMAVAYFQFHWKLKLTGWMWLPAVNQGEMAVLYCFVFLYMAAHGAGTASIDRLIWPSRSPGR
jgi:putative oxidoreductase